MKSTIWIFVLGVLAARCATGQILWKEPPPITVADWTWGPGGKESAPLPPFTFVKERMSGTNPKVEVRDAGGRHWIVKFGSEVHADTFAQRLLHALGYATIPTYYVGSGSIEGSHGLKRAGRFVAKDGWFRDGRFKLHGKQNSALDTDAKAWSWNENPFQGSHELAGLKILVMLTANWDTKDSRDGDGSNNEVIGAQEYAVTDWGASFGKSGGFFKRSRWDWNAYRADNANFVRVNKRGELEWGFKGKHAHDITSGVKLQDVRWLMPYLSRITDRELVLGLSASGAPYAVAQDFARSIRARIIQLQKVADDPPARMR